jgi:hypothetical protein
VVSKNSQTGCPLHIFFFFVYWQDWMRARMVSRCSAEHIFFFLVYWQDWMRARMVSRCSAEQCGTHARSRSRGSASDAGLPAFSAAAAAAFS